jgi:hypothetical protein
MKKSYSTKIKLVMLTVLIGLAFVLVTGCEDTEATVENNFEGSSWFFQNGGTMYFGPGFFIIRNLTPLFRDDDGYNDDPGSRENMDYNGTYIYQIQGNTAFLTFTHRKLSSESTFTPCTKQCYVIREGSLIMFSNTPPASSILSLDTGPWQDLTGFLGINK